METLNSAFAAWKLVELCGIFSRPECGDLVVNYRITWTIVGKSVNGIDGIRTW